MLDLAIVGGGPGGLMSAWYLKKKLGDLCRVTIYEASDRVGGKIVSRKFESAPAMYEAIATHKVTHLCGAPIVMATLLNAAAQENKPLPHVVEFLSHVRVVAADHGRVALDACSNVMDGQLDVNATWRFAKRGDQR